MLWTTARLDAALAAAAPLGIPPGGRIVVASDLHMADGTAVDDFIGNRERFLGFLDGVVADPRAVLVLLGDVEELWQARLPDIRRCHGAVYDRLNRLPPDRLVRIGGNHDGRLDGTGDPLACRRPGGEPAVRILVGGRTFLLTHGHQGDLLNDTWRRPTEWMVGHLWSLLERLGVPDPRQGLPSHAMVQWSTWGREDLIRHRWAQRRGVHLVCGHTHRAVFASRMHAEDLPPGPELEHERARGRVNRHLAAEPDRRPHYFNTGCGCYRGGFTTLELTAEAIRLWKWSEHGRQDYGCLPIAALPLPPEAQDLSEVR